MRAQTIRESLFTAIIIKHDETQVKKTNYNDRMLLVITIMMIMPQFTSIILTSIDIYRNKNITRQYCKQRCNV